MDHRDHRSVTLQGREKGHGSRYRGYLHFRDADKKPQFAIVSVKGGENINSAMVRDLKGTMEREKAALGFFLTLNEPTREMEREAASAGLYETGGHEGPQASNPHGRANPRQPAATSAIWIYGRLQKGGARRSEPRSATLTI
jgi:hypothetical protein